MSLDVYLHDPETSDTLYSANITHNLTGMADAAGIYTHLWRPESLGISTAGELIDPLTIGLLNLTLQPAKFKAYNAANGWGKWEHFVPWVAEYLEACRCYPCALVKVSR